MRKLRLDAKECFYLWVELGTLGKVQQALLREGRGVNTQTGKPYSTATIYARAFDYIFENLEEAYNVFQRLGTGFTYSEFLRFVIYRAAKLMNSKRFSRWVEKNSLWDYAFVWQFRYPWIRPPTAK